MALALGMTVKELLERVDSKELTEWMAYYTLEPFGQPADDLRMGIIASTEANAHRDPKRKAFTPNDFIPDYSKKHQSIEEQKTLVMQWNALLGGDIKEASE